MERQANYFIVGVLSVVLLIASFVFVVWLSRFEFNQKWDAYRIIFRGPVSGLSVGGEVQFNGIKVGEITEIRLDPNDANKVITDIRLQHETPVRADSTALTVSQGITGVKYVQITPGSRDRPLLRKVSREKPPVILAGTSRMENFVQDLSQLADSGAEALARINRLLSDGNINRLSRSIEDVNAVTGELRTRKDMFAKLDSTFGRLDRAAAEFQTTARNTRLALGTKDEGALAEVAAAAVELRAALAQTRSVVTKLDGPASELSTTTLPNINSAMNSIQRTAEALDTLTYQIQQDPRGMLGRPSGREVEIPK